MFPLKTTVPTMLNRSKSLQFLLALISSVCSVCLGGDDQTPPPREPQVSQCSREAEDAIAGFQLPEGWSASLFAAEPNVANIVAFALDDKRRAYVCESFRQNKGVTDNRGHNEEWLRADLAANTVAVPCL